MKSKLKMEAERKHIDLFKSTINWKAYKKDGGHHGTLRFKSGFVEIIDNIPSGGEFFFDMTSIYDIDQIGILKTELIKSLEGPRFFDVGKYPESKFKITNVDHVKDDLGCYAVTGDLTVKDITNEIFFKAGYSVCGNGFFFIQTSMIGVDRTRWGITFGAKGFLTKVAAHVIANVFDVTAIVVAR